MYVLIEAENKRREHGQKQMIAQAWYTGYFQRVDKFPRLESVIGDGRARNKITDPKEIFEWGKAFAQTFGKVKKKGATPSQGE